MVTITFYENLGSEIICFGCGHWFEDDVYLIENNDSDITLEYCMDCLHSYYFEMKRYFKELGVIS